ncbi:hypothetical protein [Candidatus Arsenophonus triatominarum]|uniref:hypothetical protein n=1 Tax=Candidatus Arsenophonus triatominarum TaxID=57911 RepID=UPI00164F417B|nr:hypothetical protein [Candidatus Arsenophonus triatominarum]
MMLHPAILMLSLVHVHPLEQISLFYENLLNLFSMLCNAETPFVISASFDRSLPKIASASFWAVILALDNSLAFVQSSRKPPVVPFSAYLVLWLV